MRDESEDGFADGDVDQAGVRHSQAGECFLNEFADLWRLAFDCNMNENKTKLGSGNSKSVVDREEQC